MSEAQLDARSETYTSPVLVVTESGRLPADLNALLQHRPTVCVTPRHISTTVLAASQAVQLNDLPLTRKLQALHAALSEQFARLRRSLQNAREQFEQLQQATLSQSPASCVP
jgi:hypothetical protein